MHYCCAVFELAELALNDDNLQHFTPEVMKSICSLLVTPINDVSVVASRIVWTMTSFFEICESMIGFGVIPKLLAMMTSLGMQPLVEAQDCTCQFNIIGALTRLVGTIKPEDHEIYIPDIAVAMNIASSRKQDEAIEAISQINLLSGYAELPDEASVHQYAADSLCLIMTEFPKAREILTHKGAFARLAVNLKSSNTDMIRCATVTMSIIVKDPQLRKNISAIEALAGFDALLDVCSWCMKLLEITHPEVEKAEAEEKKQEVLEEMDHREHPPVHVISDALPSILETAVVALWGCAAVVRKEENLEARAAKFMSNEDVFAMRRRRRTSAAEIFKYEQHKVNEDLWIEVCLALTTLSDSRVNSEVNTKAAAVIGYMIQAPCIAFKKNMLSHLLKLLEPWYSLALRATACVAFSRLCAAELNLSRDKKSLPHYSEQWSKFCQLILSSCGVDILFHNAMSMVVSPDDGHTITDLLYETQLRMSAACSILYLCAQYKGVMKRSQLTSLLALLTCDTQHHVQLYAAGSVWCMLRNEQNRKELGKLGACKSLLKLLFKTKDDKIQEWCSASLWLLSVHPRNAVEIAQEGYSISKLIRLTRPNQTWDAHSFMRRSQDFGRKEYGCKDIIIQNCVGCLRRVVATPEGAQVRVRASWGAVL